MTKALTSAETFKERRPGSPLHSTPAMARRRAATGTQIAPRAYRPCLLSWVRGDPTKALVQRMRRAALDWDGRSMLLPVGGRALVLLIPDDAPAGPSRERLQAVVRSVADSVRAAQPEAEIHAVVGERVTSRERLPTVAARLRRQARRYSLTALLETLDPRQASAFVEEQLAGVRAYDREHGTDLQRVLELALDHENRNTAARAAFMHRNTFRRQLGKALDLIELDLSCPEERLALHVALKMRTLGEARGRGGRFDRDASSRAAP